VNLVQVLDTVIMQWAQPTPWPGVPGFGHAGGIVEVRKYYAPWMMTGE